VLDGVGAPVNDRPGGREAELLEDVEAELGGGRSSQAGYMIGKLDPVRPAVAVLDADPDLAAGVDDQELELARQRAVAAVLTLENRGWDPALIPKAPTEGWLGLLLIDGLMLRRVTVGERSACELFGAGDLIRPWDSDGDYDPLPVFSDWRVLKPTRLAVLDTAFTLRVARWPSITSQIVGRVAQRARYLALTQAVTHLPRLGARLLILFWLLAERWGTVSPGGVHITLSITHEVLAMLVGARRPPVTIALQRLSRAGLLTRERQDRWLLTNLATERLADHERIDLIEIGPAPGFRRGTL